MAALASKSAMLRNSSPDLAPPKPKPRLSRAAIAGGSVEERRRALRRARTLATLLLVLMLVIFIATSIEMKQWPWLAYVRAFAEAGMIGACADWFAVVALFRHPLGIPIPHTAIVASSKERIGIAIGRFTANNFLSPRSARRTHARRRHFGLGGALDPAR